jgi:hypothetical protein
MAANHPAAGAFSLPNHEPNAALMDAILREYRRDAKVPQGGGSPRHYGVASVSGEADAVAAEIQEARAAEAANPGGEPWWALLWSKYHGQGIDLGVWEQRVRKGTKQPPRDGGKYACCAASPPRRPPPGALRSPASGRSLLDESIELKAQQQARAQAPETAEAASPIVAVFARPGPLGVRLADFDGQLCVQSVQPGTQAEQHPQLRAGLVLTSVDRQPVAGRGYQDVLEMIKARGRPLELSFVPADDGAGVGLPDTQTEAAARGGMTLVPETPTEPDDDEAGYESSQTESHGYASSSSSSSANPVESKPLLYSAPPAAAQQSGARRSWCRRCCCQSRGRVLLQPQLELELKLEPDEASGGAIYLADT